MSLSQITQKRFFLKVRMANAMIKSRLNKSLRVIEEANNGSLMLGCSSCGFCKPCQKKHDKPCKYPLKMRFSIESCGVDVAKLTLKNFNIPLQWSWDNVCEYSVVCGGLLTNSELLPHIIIQ